MRNEEHMENKSQKGVKERVKERDFATTTGGSILAWDVHNIGNGRGGGVHFGCLARTHNSSQPGRLTQRALKRWLHNLRTPHWWSSYRRRSKLAYIWWEILRTALVLLVQYD